MKKGCLFFSFSFLLCLLWATARVAPTAFAADTKPEVAPKPEKKVVVRVNGVEITEEDIKEEIDRIIPQASYHGAPVREKPEYFRNKALQDIILQEIKYQEAKKQNIKVKEKDVDKEVDKIRERLKGEKLEEVLVRAGLSMEGLRGKIEKRLMVSGLDEKVEKEFKAKAEKTVTEAYLLDYYENNKEKFVQPERMRLREILIRIDPGGGQKNWDEATARAEEILKRAKAGEDFATLARGYSEDEYAARGGDVGFVHKGSVMPEIEHVVEGLKIGEIGGPVWTIYGYHIVKIEEIAPPIQMEYKDVKEKLKITLKEKEYNRLHSEWINGLKKKAKVEIVKE